MVNRRRRADIESDLETERYNCRDRSSGKQSLSRLESTDSETATTTATSADQISRAEHPTQSPSRPAQS
jgi:hypothetical protein